MVEQCQIRAFLRLMENPDVRLETIHRQAQESPIIKLSLMARESGQIPIGEYGPSVIKTQDREAPWRMKALDKIMFLCGRNKTRVSLNAQIRSRLSLQAPEPVVGDRVICLRNDKRYKVFNGMLGTINSIKVSGQPPLCSPFAELRDEGSPRGTRRASGDAGPPQPRGLGPTESQRDERPEAGPQQHWYRAKIKMDSDVLFKGSIAQAQFGKESTLEYEEGQGCLFDWGYALTVHKAQGSESAQVVLFEERFFQMDDDQWRRWLYTGVTRASQELVIIGI